MASAIVHPIGRTYFKDEIESGIFAYADTAEDLLALIEAGDTARESSSPFIETDDALVDDVVREVERVRGHLKPSAIFTEPMEKPRSSKRQRQTPLLTRIGRGIKRRVFG